MNLQTVRRELNQLTKNIHESHNQIIKFERQQQKLSVDFLLEFGKSLSWTVSEISKPGPQTYLYLTLSSKCSTKLRNQLSHIVFETIGDYKGIIFSLREHYLYCYIYASNPKSLIKKVRALVFNIRGEELIGGKELELQQANQIVKALVKEA